MENIREQLLEIWREACRHIDISESSETIAEMLAQRMPLSLLLVLRFQSDRKSIETVAIGAPNRTGTGTLTMTSAPLPPAQWKRMVAWARAGQVTRFHRSEPGQASPQRAETNDALFMEVVPAGVTGDMLIGPLENSEGPAGVIILSAASGRDFETSHLDFAQQLLEPFSAALENDRRLHELNALREAAEADRRSLLSRLGRQEVNEEVVGAQTGLKHVIDRVELVAKSDVPVLILGETGTGKEVVSRAIHTRSKRGNGPFIRVNCGAIPAELIDSQLFGHEKGSFTGAAEQHQGWFERADGGTLFLDEIGELPLAAQVRLLRVLQDHQVERVGGRQPIHVDVRIVAATHRDLAAMVKQRSFREDLWYRINVFPILLPRLRERIEDIPALVRHFSQRAAIRFGLPPVEASPADLRLLSSYSWPGNIRELGAVIDRAAILGNGKTLEVATSLGLSQPLPDTQPSDEPTFYEVIPESPAPRARSEKVNNSPVAIASLDVAMREHIERALAASGGQIEGRSGTAALLGINPHTLRARMRKLKIDWSTFRQE
ncbi:MAG: sigma-54 dependent transcriptional regulator [Pirellulaceae bacterium]|nr:sigma-54 dependent transcriptional regulator [Pirellulaceae bacterium]